MILGFGATGLETNIDQKSMKNGVNVEIGFSIDFSLIFPPFWLHLGSQKLEKFDGKRIEKTDLTKISLKWRQGLKKRARRPLAPSVLSPGRGGEGKTLPQGIGERGFFGPMV